MKTKHMKSINLLLTTVAVAGMLTVSAGTPEAKADIVYSGPLTLAVPATGPGIYIDFATGATSTTAFPGWDVNFYGPTNLNFYFNPTGTTNAGVISTSNFASPYVVLTAGSLISSALPFGIGNSTARMANYRAGETGGFLGFEFENSNTGALDYAWVQLNTTGTTGYPATITGYGYENTGASILAGQVAAVPEPTTTAALASMAIGALGLRQWRRRKPAVA